MNYLQQTEFLAGFVNILGRDTIRIVFKNFTMVDRVAAMLNYYWLNLVGPNQKKNARSYKPQLFTLAEGVLVRIDELQEVASKVSQKSFEYCEITS